MYICTYEEEERVERKESRRIKLNNKEVEAHTLISQAFVYLSLSQCLCKKKAAFPWREF
jgi:hypothetical protein